MIQKHAASRLHFDFRLEIDGVLKSWAVPRGPSLHPNRRRLAVMTEDHPLDYATFEGLIPKGQYGGGPVIVWDQGTWDCSGSASTALGRGKLKFHLHGERLRGGWTLVRTSGGAGNQWLLIKERDSEAIGPDASDPAETQQTSILSGRTLQQIRSDALANAPRAPKKSTPLTKKPAPARTKSAPARTKRVPHRKPTPPKSSSNTLQDLPVPIAPKLPRLVDHPPRGDRWVHELKLDGYRMQARVAGGQVQLLTRNHQDWTPRLPSLADALAGLRVDQAVFDGELVAVDAGGATDFAALQSAFRDDRTDQLVLYLFDLLYLDGESLLDRPLLDRKVHLEPLIRAASIPRIQYLDHIEGDGKQLLDQCRQRGLEGIVSKRRDRGYQSGRADDWLKCKCRYRERFVVGGYTRSATAAAGIGAILVGYYDTSGNLIYSGRVGTGWSGRTAESLRRKLDENSRTTSPFDSQPADAEKDVVWVAPATVVEVSFNSWTRENRLRHAVLDQQVDGAPARSVVRESLTVDLPPGDPKNAAEADSTTIGESPSMAVDERLRETIGNARLTNPGRVLYPSAGYTKMDVVAYLAQVSAWLLPHLADRPVSVVRCPQGIEGECFFQKHITSGAPRGMGKVRVQAGEAEYLLINDLPGLLAAAQMNALELHPWGCRRDRLERPDRLIFDLDPDVTIAWEEVIAASWQLRERLDDLGLKSFVKTTGGKGLHVTVPLVRRHDWDRVFQFATKIVKQLAAEFPKRYTANMAKKNRTNRIFIDYHRNRRGATAVAPYSPRARAGATVATPLDWNDLTPEITPDHWTILTVPKRLATLEEDPWAEIGEVRQSLKKGV